MNSWVYSGFGQTYEQLGVYFEKNYWGKRLTEHFEKKTEFGILGVAGTTYYPSSGRWWDIPAEMVGQVYHQHNGKKWLSEYSKSTGSKVVETIIVDGLFICLHKQRIKETFDTKVEGLHFYDTTFCIKNYLSGVKIGVMYDVRVTHKSIGQTNQQWEDNKNQFVAQYKEELPISVDEFKQLKVLICCQFFNNYTGSEVSNYELGKALVKQGCDVSIISSMVGDPILSKALKALRDSM